MLRERRLATHRVVRKLPAHIECSGHLVLDGKTVVLKPIFGKGDASSQGFTQRLDLDERSGTMFEDTYDTGDGLTMFMTFVHWVTGRQPNPYLLNPFTKEEIGRMGVRWQPSLESLRWRSENDGWIVSFGNDDIGWLRPVEGGRFSWRFEGKTEISADLEAAECAFKDAWADSIYRLAAS